MTMRIHTARKNHICDECDRLIPVGTRYWRDFKEMTDDSMRQDYKSHTNCLDFSDQPKVTKFELMEMNSSLRRNKARIG